MLYTDADSLIISINTNEFYEDMKVMINKVDTSDYRKDNTYGLPQVIKEVLSTFKDQMNERM